MTTEREVKAIFKAAGWSFSEGANHTLAVSPDGTKKIPLWRHRGKDIPLGTLLQMQKDSGLQLRKK